MGTNYQELLRTRMSKESYDKLIALDNLKVMQFLGYFVEHCDPTSVYVCTDSENDIQYVRNQALVLGEEETLSHPTQTIHWDGYNDQGRDKHNTQFLVRKKNLKEMSALNSIAYHDAYRTPTGKIPQYKDLANLFQTYLNEEFSKADYEYLFTFRCDKWIEKLERTKAFYASMDPETPEELYDYWNSAIKKIKSAMMQYGYTIKPGDYKG
jgi:GTP-dependent phosphoenolpyruvate carboxykinase